MVIANHCMRLLPLFAKELRGCKSHLDGERTGYEFTYATSDA